MFQTIFGIILVIIGPVFVIKTEVFYRFIGQIPWAEDKLGAGGTRLLINIIGLILIFIGLTMIFGFFDTIIGAIFSPLLQNK